MSLLHSRVDLVLMLHCPIYYLPGFQIITITIMSLTLLMWRMRQTSHTHPEARVLQRAEGLSRFWVQPLFPWNPLLSAIYHSGLFSLFFLKGWNMRLGLSSISHAKWLSITLLDTWTWNIFKLFVKHFVMIDFSASVTYVAACKQNRLSEQCWDVIPLILRKDVKPGL